jgi:hypothetical protein
MDDRVRRGLPGFAIEIIGIGVSVVIGQAIGIVLMALGVLVLVYYYGGGFFGIVSAPRLPWVKPARSHIHKYGITMSVHYHWEDQRTWGKPAITVDDSRRWIISAWAMLDVEVRNTSHYPQRISDLYMEVRKPGIRKELVGIAEPAAIGSEREWYKRPNRRRVEWFLEPHSEGIRRPVTFSSDWPKESHPLGDDRFTIAIVAELEGGRKLLRLYLESDILDT